MSLRSNQKGSLIIDTKLLCFETICSGYQNRYDTYNHESSWKNQINKFLWRARQV